MPTGRSLQLATLVPKLVWLGWVSSATTAVQVNRTTVVLARQLQERMSSPEQQMNGRYSLMSLVTLLALCTTAIRLLVRIRTLWQLRSAVPPPRTLAMRVLSI